MADEQRPRPKIPTEAEHKERQSEPPPYCKARNLRPYNPRDCMAPNCLCNPRKD